MIDTRRLTATPVIELGSGEPAIVGNRIRVPMHLVRAWLDASEPPQLLCELRARGATVRCGTGLDLEARQLMRKLRARLTVSSWAQVAELAERLGRADIAATARTLPRDAPLHADVLAKHMVSTTGRLDYAARLLLALEQL